VISAKCWSLGELSVKYRSSQRIATAGSIEAGD
jgi:hypothetical protein